MRDYINFVQKFKNYLYRNKHQDLIILLRNIDKKLGLYIRGQMIVFSYMFTSFLILLLLVGFPNALVFALIIATTNIVPYLGPFIGGFILCLYAFFEAPHLVITGFLLVLTMQQIDGNILQPLTYGKKLSLHPLLIMAIIIVGGAISGILGILLAIPSYIVLSELGKYLYKKVKPLMAVKI